MNVNNLKTLIRIGLALVVFWLLPHAANATHIVGGDMEYDIVSIDNVSNTMTVEIKLAVYRDCFFGDPDVYFDDPAHVGIFNQANLLVLDLELDFVGVDDTLMQGLDSFCLVNLQPVCVHTSTYTGTVTLPIIPGGYTFAYQRCCRNQTINNVVDPLLTGATFLIQVNDAAIARANNSPEYKQWPPIYICANEPLVFDHGATDIDGDSLVYSLCTPFKGGTIGDPRPIPAGSPPYDTIVWVNGFSLDNLLGTGTPLTIDPQTGIMTAVPGTLGQYVVGVCVQEYDRNTGELLSTVRRDFQYNVNPCENIAANFEAPEAQCDDFTVIFENTSSGSTIYEWYANGIFFSSSDSSAIARTFPDTGSYTVELIAVPNTICADTFSQTIFLQNNSIVPDFFQTVLSCVDTAIIDLLDLSLDTVSTIESYEWIVEYGAVSDTLTGPSPRFFVPLGVSGTITLFLRNVNGCEEMLVRNFDTDLDNPTDFILPEYTVCGGVGVELNPNAPDGLNFNYSWSPAEFLDDPNAQNPTATVGETTVFSVSITNDISGCETVLNTTVTVLPTPVADFDAVPECGGVTYVFNNATVNGTTYFYDFGVTGIESDTSVMESPTFTFPVPGTYTVTLIATNSSGCADTLVRDITVVPDNPIGLNVPPEIVSCDTTVTIAPTAAAVSTTFTFEDTNGMLLGNGPTLVVEVSGVTVVNVIATDENGCTEEQLVTIIGGPVNLTAQDTVLSCGVANIDFGVTNLDANDTLTYSWTPTDIFDPATLNSPTPTFIGPFGEYVVTVTATNQFNCTTTEEIVLIVLDDTAAFDFTAEPECDGLTINFTNASTATFGYLWDFDGLGTSMETNPSFTFPGPGTYSVTLSSPFNIDCIDPITIDVEVVEAVLSADFTLTQSECSEDGTVSLTFADATLNATGDTIAYEWTFATADPPSSTIGNPSIVVMNSGDLEVTLVVTSEDGCTSTYDTTLNIQLPMVMVSEEVTICPGDSTELNPDFDPDLTYTWTPATGFDPNEPNPTVGVGGVYIVTVSTDAGDINCTASDTITVIVADSIELVLTGPDGNPVSGEDPIELPTLITCGDPVDLTAEVAANIEVVFTDIDGNPIGMGTSISLNPDTRDTVIAIATDEFGCMVSDTVVIINRQVDAAPDIAGGMLMICEAQDTMLGVINLDTGDTLTYMWEDDPIITGPLNGPTVDITPTDGTHEIDVTVTNQFGCDTTITFVVEVVPFNPNMFPDTLRACFEENITLDPEGGIIPEYVYVWDPEVNDPTSVTLSESTLFNVTITDPATGCNTTQSTQVIVAPDIAGATMVSDSILCEEGQVTFSATNAVGADVTWYSDPELTNEIGTGPSITFTVTELGVTTVYAEFVDPVTGCSEVVPVSVLLDPLDDGLPSPAVSGCAGDAPVGLFPGGTNSDYEYTYEPMESVDLSDPNNPTWAGEGSGQVTVTVVDPATGCSVTVEVDVMITDLTNLMGFADPDTIFVDEMSTVTVTGCEGCDYDWMVPNGVTLDGPNGDPSTVVIGDEAGEYDLFVDVSMAGCTETVVIPLVVEEVLCRTDRVFLPNAFSPNNDGFNDELRLRSAFTDGILEFELMIFNRWGQEMYRSFDPQASWDGTVNGEALEPDVYGFYLRVVCPNEEELIQKGNITILK